MRFAQAWSELPTHSPDVDPSLGDAPASLLCADNISEVSDNDCVTEKKMDSINIGHHSAAHDGSESSYVRQYLPLVLSVVTHLRSQAGSVVDCDDFKQVGLMGLLEALRKYGRKPDERFGAYAKQRIRGAILDDLRKKDIRSRGDRDRAHAFADAKRKLRVTLGREPSHQELTKAFKLSSKELLNLEYLEQASLQYSLNEVLHKGDYFHQSMQTDDQNPSGSMSNVEKVLMLKKALATLNSAQQAVMSLYYIDQFNMKEIAQTLSISESRVCQIHKQAMAILIKHFSS